MMNNKISSASKEATYSNIRTSILNAQSSICRAVNSAIVQAYWEIGEQIYKECGKNDRAEYGKEVLKYLSERLTAEFGKGFDIRRLREMRQFYVTFPKRHALRAELNWTHYRLIMRVDNPKAREFYIEECASSGWSTRQLERQIYSFYYERLLSSQDKTSVRNEINTLEPKKEISPQDILKEPYVLEFLGLEDASSYHEKDIEQRIINHLQQFLLEMGKGFSFVARQKKISLDGDNFYIDLVFYNYILRCYVLIDLKLGKLTHQDLGQMQMYVNYYTCELMNDNDSKPIGLILCADKKNAVIKYTLPEDNNQIFASKYKLYLPTEEELQKEIQLAKCEGELSTKTVDKEEQKNEN